jgi:hypothetical protein
MVDDKPTGQNGMLPEMKIKRPLSPINLPEENKIAYVKGNNSMAIPSISSDNRAVIPTLSNIQKGIDLKKITKSQKGVRSKQLDLLPPKYLTARLNNAQVVKIKHPSLLPSTFPHKNLSQVSCDMN